VICLDCLDRIYDDVGTVYNNKSEGGKDYNNAMRHCVGACQATNECGSVCAGAIIAHEIQSWNSRDSQIDRGNNDFGFGVAASGADCVKGCQKLWDDGYLYPPHNLIA
jgi:hypothetical protein